MYHIAIVENEITQIEIEKEMILRYSNEKSLLMDVVSFENGYDFLESDLGFYDVILMDIDLPSINGMEVSFKIREKKCKAALIFVTNLPQYAIDGYKVNAIDFILKPLTYADFSLSMNRAIASVEKNDDSIVLNYHGTTKKFQADEILYFEMIKHDLFVHLKDGDDISFRSSLNKIESLLPKDKFLKCNSGCIVNINKIKSINGDVITMENDDCISVSRSKKKETMLRINEYYSYLK